MYSSGERVASCNRYRIKHKSNMGQPYSTTNHGEGSIIEQMGFFLAVPFRIPKLYWQAITQLHYTSVQNYLNIPSPILNRCDM